MQAICTTVRVTIIFAHGKSYRCFFFSLNVVTMEQTPFSFQRWDLVVGDPAFVR